jgi:MFS family permease
MLPASAGLFLAALGGSVLARRFAARPLVRTGLAIVFVSTLLLLDTIDVTLDSTSFLIAMGVLGVGMGLVVSQLGNVVQSAIGDADRSEAGGLQNTAAQLGSSLGTALLGAVVISGLIFAFSNNVNSDPTISGDVKELVQVRLSSGGSFVASDQVRAAAEEAQVSPAETDALVAGYESAQINALKTAFLFASLIVLASFWAARGLPTERFEEIEAARPPPAAAAADA